GLQESMGLHRGIPQRRVPVVAGRGIRLRQLYDPHGHEDVTATGQPVTYHPVPFVPGSRSSDSIETVKVLIVGVRHLLPPLMGQATRGTSEDEIRQPTSSIP